MSEVIKNRAEIVFLVQEDEDKAYAEGFRDAINGRSCEKQEDGVYVPGYVEAIHGRPSPEEEG